MNFKQLRWFGCRASAAVLGLGLCALPFSARANVYATNIKLNGSLTNGTVAPGDPVTISYILNEPALLGVTIDILSGSNLVRTLSIPGDYLGTFRGLNSIDWDGRDTNGNIVPIGTYSVSITAATSGYTNWTQTTSDGDPGNHVYEGRGIAVDRNANSPYYGRVFVSNAIEYDPPIGPGDELGIVKLNADASFADEGAATTGGHAWGRGGPAKITVSDDDYVYVTDKANGGEVYRWDPTFSEASMTYVLRVDNRPPGAYLAGPAISYNGTNTEIWMADYATNYGILKWVLATNGTCFSNDLGTTVVGLSGGTNLSLSPCDVSIDKSGSIYTCASVITSLAADQRVFRFPAYDPSTNGGAPELLADWAVGTTNDAYADATGVAVDPTGTYVAASFQGIGTFPSGNTKVLYATNGALVADLDFDVVMHGDPFHMDTACAWDAVGNVYYIDNWTFFWRAVSPPGTNQSTTVAYAKIEVAVPPPPAPFITSVQVVGGNVVLQFTAGTNDVAANFGVVGAAFVTGPYKAVANVTVTRLSAGVFQATFPNDGSMQFYRITRVTAQPQRPVLTGIVPSGNNMVLTFNGSTNDTASAFTVLSAGTVNGAYSPATPQTISALSPGVFQATVPKNGPSQFYRIGR